MYMLTYGDLVTQLLIFFILLFTFSTLDAVKFRDAVISLQGAFGVLSGGPAILNLSDMPTSNPIKQEAAPASAVQLIRLKSTIDKMAKNEELKTEIEKLLQQAIEKKEGSESQQADKTEKSEADKSIQGVQGLEVLLTTIIDERGLRIRFTDPLLFDLGKADLRPESVAVLRMVADSLSTLSNRIEVQGHTDNIPISTSYFRSNWDLSTARACEVLRFLIQEGGIDPGRLSAAGYGEYKPIAPNDSKENRSKNRRVELLVLNDEESLEKDGS